MNATNKPGMSQPEPTEIKNQPDQPAANQIEQQSPSFKEQLFAKLPEGVQRSILIWRAAKQHEQENPTVNRKGDELEFLPAAVEILETPASPVGRAVSLALISLFVIAILWSWFGRIDVVASATGKVIPVGQVKAIQPLELATVRAILVKEGQKVKTGQPLIELDPTESEVDLEQVKYQLLNAQLNATRLSMLLKFVQSGLSGQQVQLPSYLATIEKVAVNWPSQPSDSQLKLQINILKRDLASFSATGKRYSESIRQQQSTVLAVAAKISRLDALIPLYQEQVDAMSGLIEKGHVSKLEWLQQEERRISSIEDRKVLVNQLQESKSQLGAIRSERDTAVQQFLQQKLTALQESSTSRQQSILTLRKAMGRQQRQIIKSPVDGTVQQLQVHTVGGVVQPAQPIMVIVPADVELEIEATVLNKDIGFVKEDHPAELKFESFPYTRFGLINGTVRYISRDAIAHEQLGSVYPIRVTMHEKEIQVGDHWQRLEPGMNVTVEIKTGDRRLIEFFLAPFLRYQGEALRER